MGKQNGCWRSSTGVPPLRRSAGALPIACDALNARTVAAREYHYSFCASSPARCHACFTSDVCRSAYPPRYVSWRIRRPARRKRDVFICPMIRRRYLAGMFVKVQETGTAERGKYMLVRSAGVQFTRKVRILVMSLVSSLRRSSSSMPRRRLPNSS